MQEKSKLGIRNQRVLTTQCEETKLYATIDTRKDLLSVFKIIQADESFPVDDMTKEIPSRMICGNTSRHDHAGVALWIDELQKRLSEQSIGV